MAGRGTLSSVGPEHEDSGDYNKNACAIILGGETLPCEDPDTEGETKRPVSQTNWRIR